MVAVTFVPAELEVLRSINSSVGGAGWWRRRKLELISSRAHCLAAQITVCRRGRQLGLISCLASE